MQPQAIRYTWLPGRPRIPFHLLAPGPLQILERPVSLPAERVYLCDPNGSPGKLPHELSEVGVRFRQAARRPMCENVYSTVHRMTETLSIRIDAATKKRLGRLAKRSRRTMSFLAAEAIATYVEAEDWQLGEIHDAIAELDEGSGVGHEKVSKWLTSWGTSHETKVPR